MESIQENDKSDCNGNPSPSKSSMLGLSWMIFCMSDVRPGVGPFLSIFLKSYLHWNTNLVGLALGTMDFMAAISQIPSGLLFDSVKIKRFILFLSCFAISCGCLIILFFPYLLSILFAQALIGVAAAIIPPSIAAITLGLVGSKLFPKRVSINETWSHTGNVITAGIVGLLGYALGHQWILYMVIFFSIASMFFLSFINPKEINHAVARELAVDNNGKKIPPMPISKFLKESSLLIFCISVFLFYYSNAAQIMLVGQVLYLDNASISSLYMGACIILGQAVMILVAYGIGFIINDYGRKPIFLIGMGVLPIRAFLYTLTDDPASILAIQLLDGVGAGVLGVMAIVIVSDIAKGTGRFNFSLGMVALSQGIGSSLSNFMSGYIVDLYGFNTGFLSLAIIAVAGFTFFLIFMPETKKKTQITATLPSSLEQDLT